MYDKNICGKEIIILGTLSNSKDSDEMLHNVAFIIKVFMVSKDKIPLTERYTWTSLQENDNMWPPSLHAMDSPKYTVSNQKEGSWGAQWLSGRVLDSRPKGRGFEPHRRHCVVVLEQDTFILA